MQVKFVILVHDERKLFYVCTHDVNTKTKIGWKNVAQKAKASYQRNIGHNANGSILAMVNTGYEGWRDIACGGDYNKENEEYIPVKQFLIDMWELAGYTNVGMNLRVSNKANNGAIPAHWNSKFNVNNMTKEKVYSKIDFCSLSLGKNVPQNIRNAAFMEIVGLKPTVDFKVDSMITLLKFVRTKMGMDNSLPLALAA